jgi:hypothetical protein
MNHQPNSVVRGVYFALISSGFYKRQGARMDRLGMIGQQHARESRKQYRSLGDDSVVMCRNANPVPNAIVIFSF